MEKLRSFIKNVYNQADIDFIIREADRLTEIEFRQTFSQYKESAQYTYNLLKKFDIDADFLTFPADGKKTYQDFRTPLAWRATTGKLTVVKSEIKFDDPVVADYEKHPFHLIKGSCAPEGGKVQARLLTEEQVLNGADATGAIVLFPSEKYARSNIISPVLDKGAIGFISSCVGRRQEKSTPDCIAWCNAATDDHSHWHVQSEDRSFIGFSVSPKTGDLLREACACGEVILLVESDAERYEGEINAVCGYIPGKSDKEIWLIAHLFEPFITDNSLSVMFAIEIANKIKKLGTPNFSIRLVFSAETYGLAAVWDYYKNALSGKVLGALDIDTPPAFTYDKNFDLRFNPYCSPFYGNAIFLLCAKVFEKAFPDTEKCARSRIEFGDDLIVGDPTIGIPTIYFEEEKCVHWHSSYWDVKHLDPDKVRRSYSICALWTFILAFLDEKAVRYLLPECVEISKEKLLREAKANNSKERMEYFLHGEQKQIRSFAKAVDIPEIYEAADTLSICPDNDTKFESPALCRAENIIPKRETEGFPYDLIRFPYEKRRPLPNSMIYGAFATVIAGIDGKRNLRSIITDAIIEHNLDQSSPDTVSNNFIPLEDSLIERYIDAVLYLADGGYLSLEKTCNYF